MIVLIFIAYSFESLSNTFKDDIDQSILERTDNNKDILEQESAKPAFGRVGQELLCYF